MMCLQRQGSTSALCDLLLLANMNMGCADASIVTPSANLSEPIVRVTLRISTSIGNVSIVETELKASVANSSAPMVEGFRAKGHNVSDISIDTVTSSFVSSHPPFLYTMPDLMSLFI